MKYKFWTFFFFSFYWMLSGYGQNSGFESFSIEDGLPQSEIYALVQTHDGAIWVGTNGGGLARFNGKEFEVYNKTDGLPDNIITSLYEDDDHILWIGSSTGITRFDGQHFVSYPIRSQNGTIRVISLKEDNNQRIWMNVVRNRSQYELYYHDKQTDTLINFTDKGKESKNPYAAYFNHNPTYNFLLKEDGGMLISTQKTLYEFNNDSLFRSDIEQYKKSDDEIIIPIHQEGDSIWCRSIIPEKEHTIKIFYNNRFIEAENFPENFPKVRIFEIMRNSTGKLWFTTVTAGILLISEEESSWFNSSNVLPSNFAGPMIEDHEGNMWFGLSAGGLIKYGKKRFLAHNFNDVINSNIVRLITQDSKGDYWFHLQGGGLVKYDGTRYYPFTIEEYPFLNNLVNLIPLEDGKLLIVGFLNIYEYRNGAFYNVKDRFNLSPLDRITYMQKNNKDEYYFSLQYDGLYRFKDGISSKLNYQTDTLADNFIHYLYFDSKGDMWVCSNENIAKYSDGSFDYYNKQDGADWILQAVEDSAGNYWFASYEQGLLKMDNDTFIVYNPSNSKLSSDNIYSLLIDHEGNLWAGTQHGVDKISLDASGNITSWRTFDQHHGFTGIENNGKANYVDNDGNLWFGTIKGVMQYFPESEDWETNPPITNMRAIELFYEPVDWTRDKYQDYYDSLDKWSGLPSGLILPHHSNNITFNFEGISYQVPEKILFQWQLTGLEEEWSPLSFKRSATFTNLSPGAYTFLLRAANSEGKWNEPIAYDFQISPPFYATWWFRILVLLLIIILIYTLFRMRLKAIKDKKKYLEQLVARKTHEIRVQKERIEDNNRQLEEQKEEIISQAEKLKQSLNDLERLTEIGQVITAKLTVAKINDTVYNAIHNIMDASSFGIGIYDEKKKEIHFTGVVEEDVKVPDISYSMDERQRLAVYCLEHREDILINDYFTEYKRFFPEMLPSKTTKNSHSIIYLPLISSGRPLGVITVQSFKKNAFNNYHVNILRNIAVYAMIAIENASAYEQIEKQAADLKVANESIKKQKNQIQSKNDELIEINNEKNHLIGIIAHDLRNPLTSSLSIARTLKDDKENLTEDQIESLDYMLKALWRMNKMISKILDIRVVEAHEINLKKEKVNLASILKAVECNYLPVAGKKNIQINSALKDVAVELDKGYTAQVFENLLSNAIKFSPKDSEVFISMFEENGHARVVVEDQGPGITDDDMKKLFGKFQLLSAKPTGGEKSIGLGLSIVKKYVEAMDGKVWCESEPGKGARFNVTFKRWAQE